MTERGAAGGEREGVFFFSGGESADVSVVVEEKARRHGVGVERR